MPRTKTVSLRAARNEFVAFQVVVETDSGLTGADIHLSPLGGPGGAVIGDKYVAPFKEWYVEVRRPTTGYERLSLGPGWYPDALMPERRAKLFSSFHLDTGPVQQHSRAEEPGNLDRCIRSVRARRGAPGRYTGDVKVTWKGGGDAIHVALDVWDFALPQETHLPGDIWNGSMRNMPPKEELAYYQMARQHRFTPLSMRTGRGSRSQRQSQLSIGPNTTAVSRLIWTVRRSRQRAAIGVLATEFRWTT